MGDNNGTNRVPINEILASIGDDCYVLDHHWNFVFANNEFTSKRGKAPIDFIGNNIWTMFPKHIGTEFEKNLREAMDKREIQRFDLRGKYTDAYYRIAVFPSVDGITLLGVDITADKKAEFALRDSEERYRTLFKYMNEGFFLAEIICDKANKPIDFRYIASNDAMEKILNVKNEDIVGKTRSEVFSTPNDHIEIYGMVALTGKPIIFQDFSVNLNRYFSISVYSPQQNQFACLAEDITELILNQQEVKSIQDQLLRNEISKNELLETSIKMKDDFLYLITHEFKTPMAVITLALQAIDSFCQDNMTERLGRYINTIKTNTNRQLRLVNNLLDVTRLKTGNIKIRRGKFDMVVLTRFIVHSVDIYALQKNINLKFESTLVKKEIYIDDEKFERIMLNLLSNAVKFTPQGKCITVLLSVEKHRNTNYLNISVKDQGIGIPVDKHKEIFQRFGQADTSLSRQAEGTGLGLHLVNLLVNALGGQITFKSEIGKGSTFTVLLPEIKSLSLEEATANNGFNNQLISGDNRIIQAASIEFSDLYFD